jgi:hypothetical protein
MTVSSQTDFSLGSGKMVFVMVLFVGRMMVAAIMMQPSSNYADHEHDLAFHPNPLAAAVVGQRRLGQLEEQLLKKVARAEFLMMN